MNIFNHHAIHVLLVISSAALFFIFIATATVEAPFPFVAWLMDNAELINVLFLVGIGVMVAVILRFVAKETRVRTAMLIAESSKKYMQDLEESYQALRALKHDYVNILVSMKLWIDQGDMAGLADYFYGELASLNQDLLAQNRMIQDLHYIHVNEIKSVLVYKCALATQQGIAVDIEVGDPIRGVGVSTAVVCQIIGILLDNAIEAAAQAADKKLDIAMMASAGVVTLIIKNTWQPQAVTVNKLFELGYSTKGPERGVGLYTVRNYTNKLSGVYLDTAYDNAYFTQTLSLY